MAHFSDDKLEKGKCLEFCTPEGQEDFFNYCNRPRRNIIEVSLLLVILNINRNEIYRF